MLLRQIAKIPVGIFAFVAASSAVEQSSKYYYLLLRDILVSIIVFGCEKFSNFSKHCEPERFIEATYPSFGEGKFYSFAAGCEMNEFDISPRIFLRYEIFYGR